MKSLIATLCLFLHCFLGYADDSYLDHIHRGLDHYQIELSANKRAQFDTLFLAIQAKEKEFQGTHYQVITAQNSVFLAFQIILKEVYQKLDGRKYPNYEFMRIREDLHYRDLAGFFMDYPELLAPEIAGRNDLNPVIGTQLISASLSMDVCPEHESALHVFFTGLGMSPFKESEFFVYEKLVMALDATGIRYDKNALRNLLDQRPKSDEGILVQIFIPKGMADRAMYAAFDKGFRDPKGRRLDTYFSLYHQDRGNAGFNIFDHRQVRLLAGALDSKQVKMFRYTTIPAQKINDYVKKVRGFLAS